MGFGLVNTWVGQGFVSKMGWLDFFFWLKKVDNAEGLYWVTFEIGSMGYLRWNNSEQVDGMVGRCNESRWQAGIELATTGLLLCRKEGQN